MITTSHVCCMALLAMPFVLATPMSPQLVQPQPQLQQQQQSGDLGAQLGAIQAQAQRQLGQLNGLVMNAAANLTSGSSLAQTRYSNVLEAISSVGKALQQQIHNAASASQQVHIVGPQQELANSHKNEYQALDYQNQPTTMINTNQTTNSMNNNNYRQQSEQLRQEIVRRAGQLQQVVAGSMDLLKNNGDLIVRRLLEQLNSRLDQAKSKADRILNEPATNEVALKALATINHGLNNLNNIINNIVTRLDSVNQQQQQQLQSVGQRQATAPIIQPLLDTTKLRLNLQQLGQQFSSALNSTSVLAQLQNRNRLQNTFSMAQPLQQQQQQEAVASNKINTDFNTQQRRN